MEEGNRNRASLITTILIVLFFLSIIMLFASFGKISSYFTYINNKGKVKYDYDYKYGYADDKNVNISGYSSLVKVYDYYYARDDEGNNNYDVFRRVKIDKYDDNTETIDIYDLFLEYLEADEREESSLYKYFPEANVYELDENRTLYLTDFSVNVDTQFEKVDSYHVEGYLLTK